MTEAFAPTLQTPASRAIRVPSPRIGDLLSGALHAAYDDHSDMPDEFARLLARIDRMECRPH